MTDPGRKAINRLIGAAAQDKFPGRVRRRGEDVLIAFRSCVY